MMKGHKIYILIEEAFDFSGFTRSKYLGAYKDLKTAKKFGESFYKKLVGYPIKEDISSFHPQAWSRSGNVWSSIGAYFRIVKMEITVE